MTTLLHYVVCSIAASVVLSQNAPQQTGATTANFNCPQERGQFEYPGNCSRYYQCDAGVPTVSHCAAMLIFNAQAGFCDWPHKVANPNCPGAPAPLTAETSDICRRNPGKAEEAFIVGHPTLCNAFYVCSSSYLHPQCSFCGEGTYFNTEGNGCRDYLATGLDITAVCQGRQFIEHKDKLNILLEGRCWTRTDSPNPYWTLLQVLTSGAQVPNSGPQGTNQGQQRPTQGPQFSG